MEPIIFVALKFVQKNHLSLIRFVIVGGLTFTVNYSIFFTFYEYFNINLFFSVAIAYFIASLFHFLANNFFTFELHSDHMFIKILKYLILLGFNYIVVALITWVNLEVFKFTSLVGYALSTIIMAFFNYLVMLFFVFRR